MKATTTFTSRANADQRKTILKIAGPLLVYPCPGQRRLALDQIIRYYRRQLEVYAHIIEALNHQQVSRMHLYYTSKAAGNPYITFRRDTQAIDHATFDHIVHRIESQDYAIPARPAHLCTDCDMSFYCDRKNWHFREDV